MALTAGHYATNVGVSTVLRIAQEAGKSSSENHKSQTFRTPVRKIRIDSAGGSAVTAALP